MDGKWFEIGDSETKHALEKSKRLDDHLILKITKIGSDNIEVKIKNKDRSNEKNSLQSSS